METEIKQDLEIKTNEILSRYKGNRDELINILQETQEKFRYLPEEAMEKIAEFLKIPVVEIYSVATFYALFRLTPSGKKLSGFVVAPPVMSVGARMFYMK